MKKMKKLLYLFISASLFISCSDDDMEPAFSDSGWIDFTSATSSSADSVGSTDVGVAVNLGTNLAGQTITYSVELITGTANDSSVFGTYTQEIPSEDTSGFLSVPISTTDADGYEALVTILSSDGMYDAGLSDGSKLTEHTITVCQDRSTELLSGPLSGFSELDGTGVEIYSPILTPVAGENNVYETDNIWGGLVEVLTGGAAPPIPYPGTLTLNDDLTVDFVGSEGYATGGTGFYNACTNEIFISLTQDLFTTDFTVEVYLY
jgi:hypothetical protein